MLFTPNKVGTWSVICNELCGEGHAQMRARLIIQTPQDYAAWAAKAQATVRAMKASSSSSTAAH